MRMNCGMIAVAALLLLSGVTMGAEIAPGAATMSSLQEEFTGGAAVGTSPRASCAINNMQGSLASGYLEWTAPGGGMAVYVDPEGTGGSGDPGCGANPYSFMIESVDLQFADAVMFSQPSGSGNGTLQFSIGINCPTDDGTPCSEPNLEIFRSANVTLTVPPEGQLRDFNVPINTCVDGPFFVIVHFESWTGADDHVPSILWDDVIRPSCRQWITTDGGSSWIDMEAYFDEGDDGWANIVVNGNTSDACGPSGNCGGPPPVGACCLPDGSCIGSQTPGDCDALDGIFQGADSDCFFTVCPQPPVGACCTATGCVEVSEFDCDGTWLGADTVCGGDCDSDGIADNCAIALDLVEDCQPNLVPDECDIASGTSDDDNLNGIPDECEFFGFADMNCDGLTNGLDVGAFVLAMLDPTAYETMYPWCDAELADCNHDGYINTDDVEPFIGLLMSIATEIYDTQLAGNSLSEYPYFHYVKAFNESETVELAIDPNLYPEIVGKTADIYVVEEKLGAAWDSDPTLVDLTTDGPMTVTFSGTTIQENTFLVVGPDELDSSVYQAATGNFTGLGHGYDMVIDTNRNGLLDLGDYIDGRSKEAGLYIVHDTTEMGPLAVTRIASYNVGTIYGIPGGYGLQRLYFPTNVASMEPLPLIVISHGNGHEYNWYDHIGYHMASYGYIVVGHDNATESGIDSCSLTTCGHTDAVIALGQSGSISGAEAIAGKIDTSRIIWIGHSRGAEGVAMAYHRVAHAQGSCAYVPDPNNNWDEESIVLVSSMLPTDFYGYGYTAYASCTTNPKEVNYHLWTAAGDGDVDGGPSSDIAQTYHLHDRAENYRMSTVVQGTGHAWFHDGGGTSWFEGPCPIGEENTHLVQLGLFLPMIKHYAESNIPATDYFWRQYEAFRPPSVPTGGTCSATGDDSIVVTSSYRNGADEGNMVIDDFQTQTSTSISSSGGAVSYNVQNVHEGRLDDGNTTFTWSTSDPMNGFTYGATNIPDSTRGVVFDWNGTDRYFEWEIIPEFSNFSNAKYLSFRAGQGTRHPQTIAEIGDLTFTVTLRDAYGTTSSINIGAYGGGIEEPYQRTGEGTGTGWAVEFETIRIRPADFTINGTGLDLTNIVALRFDFGPSWGSNEGRLGVDSVMLTNDNPPYFAPLSMTLVTDPPEFMAAHTPLDLDVVITLGDDSITPGTAFLHYCYDGVNWETTPLTNVSGDLYRGTLPAANCDDAPQYYFTVEGDVTGQLAIPESAPTTVFISFVGTYVSILDDNFETDLGWTIINDPNMSANDGQWERGVPIEEINPAYLPPETDFDGSGQCYLTGNTSATDLDHGPTQLISPTFDLSTTTNPVLRFAYYWWNDDQDSDPMTIEISNDDGATWITVQTIVNVPPQWFEQAIYIAPAIAPEPLTSQMKVRISVMDEPNNSKDEGAIDAVQIFDVSCN